MSYQPPEGERCVTFVLNAGDLAQARRLALRNNLTRPRAIITISTFTSIVIALAVGFVLLTDGRVMLSDVLTFGIGPLLGIVGAFGQMWMLIPAGASRTLRESPVLQQPCTRAWSDDGFTAASVYGQGVVPWSDLHGWTEDRNVIVIYESKGVGHIIPKRALAADQVDDLRRCAVKIPAVTNG